jgi:DNA transposition AAA+ family ATPase
MSQQQFQWPRIKTLQTTESLYHLQKLYDRGGSGMIIGSTGFGKTDVIRAWSNKYGKSTFTVVASKAHKLKHILNELVESLGLGYTDNTLRLISEKEKVDIVVKEMKSLRAKGQKAMIIIDESENVDIKVLKTIKTFYDALGNICAIVLIGTPELLEKMLNKHSRHRGGIPQLYRRLKVGTKILSEINLSVEFPKFFKELGMEDQLEIIDLIYEKRNELRGVA